MAHGVVRLPPLSDAWAAAKQLFRGLTGSVLIFISFQLLHQNVIRSGI